MLMETINPRRRRELRAVLRAGRMSRSQLVAATQLRKNTVLTDVAALLAEGVLREVAQAVPSGGRPRTPLEIDPIARHVVGVSIEPGCVQARRMNLLGEPTSPPAAAKVRSPKHLVPTAERLLRDQLDDRTLMVGVTAPGFIDRSSHELRFSAAAPRRTPLSLAPLVALAGDRPVVLENDVHARAACWLAVHRPPQRHDTLFVGLEDGRLGATLLIDGRPNLGSVGGANELGHNRLPIDTPRCYCGHQGCLERIFSTPYLRHIKPAATRDLADRIRRCDRAADAGLRRIIELLAHGLANAVNLLRVETLVLATRLPDSQPFLDKLADAVRSHVLAELNRRLQIQSHIDTQTQPPDAAAQAALARLFYDGW
ncbi:ROK family protein [Phycisphaerales bacterium AB-hyl4]|uniref:ROK family protein n=1 Tax=Natronomicrosphaera hydrolytica TaxID=3242702 RepID=A0ABV4U883_9BACT